MTKPPADASPQRSTRRITPRGSLPSGRALVGAFLIVAESIASGPLPGAEIIDVVVVGTSDAIPQLRVTLRLEVDFVMAPALPGDLDSTTITRTRSVSILG
ncbi:MAG: hypothetical protein VWZ83_07985 [Acidimicrobiaceae bacterium]